MDKKPGLLRLNGKTAGASGRRKFCFGDWDHDGELDLLVNSVNVDWFKGQPLETGQYRFENKGAVTDRFLPDIRPVQPLLTGIGRSTRLIDWGRGRISLSSESRDRGIAFIRGCLVCQPEPTLVCKSCRPAVDRAFFFRLRYLVVLWPTNRLMAAAHKKLQARTSWLQWILITVQSMTLGMLGSRWQA